MRPDGDHGLLAVGGADRLEGAGIQSGLKRRIARHQLLEDVGDLFLDLFVQHQFAAAEPGHHLDGHVVGCRPQAAAGDDQVHALIGHETQLRLDVGRAVAADGDVRQLDAQLEEPIGDPGTVPVLDPPGEDFGSGDHDARACAHRHEPTHELA